MKVALSLEVTDDQRRELACRIAGKSVARLATRDEVREFVGGAVGSLTAVVDGVSEATDEKRLNQNVSGRLAFTGAEAALAESLRSQGKCESYIRGYIAAGRKTR